MRVVFVLFVFCLALVTPRIPTIAQQVCLFDQISSRASPRSFAGLSVDGDGKLQDYLHISSARSQARLILTGAQPTVFTSLVSNVSNPCMKGFGLGTPTNSSVHEFSYNFKFKPGYSTSWFQFRPLDFGDNNIDEALTASVWMEGYRNGKKVAESNYIRRQNQLQSVVKKYDACEGKMTQDKIQPLLIRAARDTSFDEIGIFFTYRKGASLITGKSSDPSFALVDVCYEVLVPVCRPAKNPPCSCLASHLWEKRAFVTIINTHRETVHVHWVNDNGVEGRTLAIKAGTRYVINTYITHAFRIRDNCGELLNEFLVTQPRSDLLVNGIFTKSNCDVLCPAHRRPKPTKGSKTARPNGNGNGTSTARSTARPTTPKATVLPMDPVAPIDCIPVGAPRPRILELVAVLRDLKASHPDMNSTYRYERHIVENLIGVDGKPVYNKSHTSITTTGASNFHSWFNTAPSDAESRHNFAVPLQLLNGTNVYIFGSSSFFPLDNHLLGNERGDYHNYFWTLELHAEFTYKGGEKFKFTGNDDAWVYVNGQLVIDLGGVHGPMSREIDLDELASDLGLVKGYTYPFALFYANRKKSTSDFHIVTSIVLKKDCAFVRRDNLVTIPPRASNPVTSNPTTALPTTTKPTTPKPTTPKPTTTKPTSRVTSF